MLTARRRRASTTSEPYGLPPTRGPSKDQEGRYGATEGALDEEPSKTEEGPTGKEEGGRKPEGRKYSRNLNLSTLHLILSISLHT